MNPFLGQLFSIPLIFSVLLGVVAGGCSAESDHLVIYKQQSNMYDAATRQVPVTTHAGIDAVFASFQRVPTSEQDTAQFFRRIAASPNPGLRRGTYYKVTGPDIFRFVLHSHRLYEFLPHDALFSAHFRDRPLYFRLAPATFHLVLDFFGQLEAQGLDPAAVSVRYGYRDPMYNLAVGGALRSQHIYGTAIDLEIGDLNGDGTADATDKTAASDLLEPLVGNKGGLGDYPGTQVLHVDTRGRRARWQSYTPGKARLKEKK